MGAEESWWSVETLNLRRGHKRSVSFVIRCLSSEGKREGGRARELKGQFVPFLENLSCCGDLLFPQFGKEGKFCHWIVRTIDDARHRSCLCYPKIDLVVKGGASEVTNCIWITIRSLFSLIRFVKV